MKKADAAKDVEQQEFLFTAGGDANGTAAVEGGLAVPCQAKRTLTIQSRNHTYSLVFTQTVENLCPHKPCTQIFTGFFHNCQRV